MPTLLRLRYCDRSCAAMGGVRFVSRSAGALVHEHREQRIAARETSRGPGKRWWVELGADSTCRLKL
jgi:hypothetical protein